MSDKPETLQQRHSRHCIDDVAAIFSCAARNLDFRRYAFWLAEFRRINLEQLPGLPLKQQNLNVLFSHRVSDKFLEIYAAADTGINASPEAVEAAVIEDTRLAIQMALAYLQEQGNVDRLRALAAAKLEPAMYARSVWEPSAMPGEEELRRRVDSRLAAQEFAEP